MIRLKKKKKKNQCLPATFAAPVIQFHLSFGGNRTAQHRRTAFVVDSVEFCHSQPPSSVR
jgi:hypothetical protein